MTERAPTRGVRYDHEMGEFQMRCDMCARAGRAAYWPLTLEFWSPKHGLARCKGCHDSVKARQLREKLRRDPARYAAKLAANREQKRIKNRIYEERRKEKLLADPVAMAARREQNRILNARRRARQKAMRHDLERAA